jgi:hypothetical protein
VDGAIVRAQREAAPVPALRALEPGVGRFAA